MLSRDDFIDAIAEGHLKIYPFEKRNLTGIGYNLSTTNFAFSINRGILLALHQEITEEGVKRYVVIPKNDTVLFFSKEYIEIDQTLAGTFHSKVSQVCQGVGHISTTLDPTWKGQLILSVNNPTSKDIRFDVDTSSGNIMTMLLYKLDSEVTGDCIHDNNQGRCDLLLKHFARPFPNKKYKSKHAQLEEFVVGEFANSLNGYDSFIDSKNPEDKYTQKVKCLLNLRNRLEKDMILLRENRYLLGVQGKYYFFINKEEINLIRSCSLFEIKHSSTKIIKLDEPVSGIEIKNEDIPHLINSICEYIDIINYELEIINHIRRINWQNEKINQFAGEESKFVRLRLRNAKIWSGIILVIFLIASLAGGWTMWKKCPDIVAIVVTVYAPVSVLFLEWWKDSFIEKINKMK